MTGASRAAIEHHYGLDDRFFEIWLGPDLVYSAGLWEEGDASLEDAQRRNHDWMIDRANARGAKRVLDIGCGWGLLLERLLEAGVSDAVGLTLSESQARRSGARLEHWADHEPTDPYDAVIAVESFEHFADLGMSREEKVDAYRAFFSRARRWLPRGGRLVMQFLAKGNARLDRQALEDGRFLYTTIFPETDTPRLAEMLQATEHRFEPVELRLDPADYARTLRVWAERLAARRDEAVALVGEQTVADYERYFTGGVRWFESGYATLVRVALVRV